MKKLLALLLVGTFTITANLPAYAQNRDVELVQRALVLAGFDPGPVDGFWGARTRTALSEMATTTGMRVAPEGPSDFDVALEQALVAAFNMHSEAIEVDEPHLQQLMTLSDARHLLERAGIGAHPSEVQELIGLTRSEAISLMIDRIDGRNTQVQYPSWINAEPFPHYWIRWDYEEEERQAFRTQRDSEIGALREWWVREMIATERPQAERLILLWSNHFVTAYSGVQEESHAIAFQHQTFRELGHGNFRDLVSAMIRDAAMLNYLDNNRSRREAPNENLARELMELFTLGEGNYSEEDVREVARALTGYGYNRVRRLEFAFNPWDHDPDQKNLFGSRGRYDGDDVLNILLSRPEAALFITRKFWSVYVSEFNYDSSEIEQVANQFRESDYDIKTLLRQVLNSPAFWAEGNRGTIVKSPVDLFIGTIRTSGILPEWWTSLPNRMAAIGQNLFEAPNVAGWPGGADWLTPSRLLVRSEMLNDIAQAQPASESDDMAMMMSQMMVPEVHGEAAYQPAFVRYAAEDFRGPPRFRVTAIEENADGSIRTAWQSEPMTAVGGIDTERFGRVNFDSLPWRISKLELPSNFQPTSFRVEFLNDHCCGPGGSDGGDRNFYVDWISTGERTFPASRGSQSTRCRNPNSDSRPGRMYCAGTVVLSEYSDIAAGGEENPTDTATNVLRTSRVAFEWADRFSTSDRRVSFSIGLLEPQVGSIATEALMIQIVRQQHERGRRIYLQLSSRRCYPDCFDGGMPRAAYKNDESGELALHFVLSGPEWDEERAQWNQLSADQQRFVSALWMAVPDLLSAAQQGRNWRERDAAELFEDWGAFFEEVEELLPRSRYARLAPENRLEVRSDLLSGSNMMMGMMGSAGAEPITIAGLEPAVARFDNERWRFSDMPVSELFLAGPSTIISPPQQVVDISVLSSILNEPVYNLK